VRYLRDELLIVLGTSSSESVLPRMLTKMENAGAAKPVVGLVIPTGYSFNLDGTSIYLTMAAVFIAQATNTHLSLSEQLLLMAVAFTLLFLTLHLAAMRNEILRRRFDVFAGDVEDGGPGTDFHAVMQGYVSITPLQLDRTFHEAFGGLDSWLEGVL